MFVSYSIHLRFLDNDRLYFWPFTPNYIFCIYTLSREAFLSKGNFVFVFVVMQLVVYSTGVFIGICVFAMIVFVSKTIFAFAGMLMRAHSTIVCRCIRAFCNYRICFQNNLCICAFWQVVGCHSDRSDGTLAYSTRLPSLLVAHLQKPIARRTSTNICNGIRDICNGHAKKFTTNKHKLWLYKAAAGVIMYIGIVFKYYEIIVTIICHHEIVTKQIVTWSGRPPAVCLCICAFCYDCICF